MKDQIIAKKHKKDCSAVKAVDKGIWNSAWFITDKHVWKRSRRFLVLRCNSIQCNAELHVQEDYLLKSVEKK